MSNFTNPFRSKRITDVSPPVRQPSVFETVGGWSDATSPSTLPEDLPSEREQRSAGATALATLYRERRAEQRAAIDEALTGVARGHDFSLGLRFREGS